MFAKEQEIEQKFILKSQDLDESKNNVPVNNSVEEAEIVTKEVVTISETPKENNDKKEQPKEIQEASKWFPTAFSFVILGFFDSILYVLRSISLSGVITTVINPFNFLYKINFAVSGLMLFSIFLTWYIFSSDVSFLELMFLYISLAFFCLLSYRAGVLKRKELSVFLDRIPKKENITTICIDTGTCNKVSVRAKVIDLKKTKVVKNNILNTNPNLKAGIK